MVESVFVKIKIDNSLIILGSIYRPPNANVAYFEAIKCQFENISNLYLNTILMCDFNLNTNDKDKFILISELELLVYQLK